MGVAEVRDGKVARVLAKGSFAHAVLTDGDSLLVGQMEAGVLRLSLSGQQNDVQRQKAYCRADLRRCRELRLS